MKHFIVYDKDTGTVLRSGVCADADFELQVQNPNEGVIEATADAVVVAEVNLEPVRESAYNRIDAEAEKYSLNFITPGASQAMRYMEKRTEAASWVPGVSDENDFPFLSAEAIATGVTVDEIATAVNANANQWRVIGSRIEAARLKAKKQVREATNIAEIHASAQIDWPTVLS